jgi:hypothetical protein
VITLYGFKQIFADGIGDGRDSQPVSVAVSFKSVNLRR